MQSIDPGHQGPTTLNSTTSVEICAAPAAGKRRQVLAIRTKNLDTLVVGLILERDVSGVKTEIDRSAAVPAGAIDRSFCSRNEPIHLVGATQSLYMKLAGAVATNQPTVEVEFLESTD